MMSNQRQEEKELVRITMRQVIEAHPKFTDLRHFLLGKNVINNPKAIRRDDPITGDIIFYELKESQ